MKKTLLTALIIGTFSLNAQTVSELKEKVKVLKQQNERLQEKATFCDSYNTVNSEVKTFDQNFEFTVLECKGNALDQTVTVTITIKHNLPHQQLSLYTGTKKPFAYGETGNNYDYKNAIFPGGINKTGVIIFSSPTNILLKGTIIFRNVLPQTEKLSLVNGTFAFKNIDGGGNSSTGEFEVRNLNISWK
jgi:hypothetical protein